MQRSFVKALSISSLLILTACATVSKYATSRYFEIYSVNNLSACNFRPRFNDCAESMSFDVKISDSNEKLAISKYINETNETSYFGFTRKNYQQQTKPIRDFLLWVQNRNNNFQHISMLREAGNTGGYLYENKHIEYTFDFIHTRADIPMLVIHAGKNDHYYGFTYEEAKTLIKTLDSWQDNSFLGEKLT